jgi:carboxymethylenebutenolidase
MSSFTLALPDGAMEVRIFPPKGSPRRGVLFLMDAFGLRPELGGMAARYAAAGWLTLMPDLYRRLDRRAFPTPTRLGGPPDAGMLAANEGTTLAMTTADLSLLLDDAGHRFGLTRFGVVGYCMGARHAIAIAVARPDRVLAAAGLHGGRMVNGDVDSPHALIERSLARIYLAMARDDPDCPEPHQLLLEEVAARCGARVEIERVDALHGWTFPGRYCHDADAAAASFSKVVHLFDTAVGAPTA